MTWANLDWTFSPLDSSQAEIRMSLNQGQFLVIYFLSSECPCSQSHEDELFRLAQKYENHPVRFLGVISDKYTDVKKIREYFSERDWPFPLALDLDLTWANRLRAYKTPHVFVFDAKEQLLYQGGVTNSRDCERATEFYLDRALNQMIQSEPINPSKTKAMGCVIYR